MPFLNCLPPLGYTIAPGVSNLFYLEAQETSWLLVPTVKEYSMLRIQRSLYPCSSGRRGTTLSSSNNKGRSGLGHHNKPWHHSKL